MAKEADSAKVAGAIPAEKAAASVTDPEKSSADKGKEPEKSSADDTKSDKDSEQAERDEFSTDPVEVEAFDTGYKYFTKKNYKKACPYFFRYISKNSPDVQDYEWAEFFFGVCLKKIGFSHGSVDTLSWLVTRKPNTKIVTYILEIFEDISRTLPYDYEQVILKAVCDQDYGFVDSRLTNFIHYHQGLFDWKNGFDDWGNNHFDKIRKNTYYYHKYRYQKALYHLLNDDIDICISILTEIEESDLEAEDLKNDVRKTLARLKYEMSEYEAADELYKSISSNIVYQAQNLLERSWAQYRIGNQEKAMGLLYAFKAPVYRNYFTPEYFLLKSFIYKDVCHYQRALSVIDEFREHYKSSLINIYDRNDLRESDEMLLAMLGKRKVSKLWNFLLLLEKERKLIQKFDDEPELTAHLNKVYDLQISETTHEFKLLLEETYEDIANDLLEYEEKADLMAYEVGLDMYQRVYQYHYDEEDKKAPVEKASRHYYAFFPFQGEFWNDELDNYKVVLEDKCANMEEWDIFFK